MGAGQGCSISAHFAPLVDPRSSGPGLTATGHPHRGVVRAALWGRWLTCSLSSPGWTNKTQLPWASEHCP